MILRALVESYPKGRQVDDLVGYVYQHGRHEPETARELIRNTVADLRTVLERSGAGWNIPKQRRGAAGHLIHYKLARTTT